MKLAFVCFKLGFQRTAGNKKTALFVLEDGLITVLPPQFTDISQHLPHGVLEKTTFIIPLCDNGHSRQSILSFPFAAPELYSVCFKAPAHTTRRFSLPHPQPTCSRSQLLKHFITLKCNCQYFLLKAELTYFSYLIFG